MQGRCDLCDNRRYVLKGKKWIPCRCLDNHRRARTYKDAGIAPIFWEYTWTDFQSGYPQLTNPMGAAKKIVGYVTGTGQSKRFAYVVGSSGGGKQAFVSLLLKEFVGKGLSCAMVSLDELIELCFDRDSRDRLRDLHEVIDVVCVRIGTVTSHSWARVALERFYNARRNAEKYAIFTSRMEIEKSEGLYGIEMAKVFGDLRRVIRITMKGG